MRFLFALALLPSLAFAYGPTEPATSPAPQQTQAQGQTQSQNANASNSAANQLSLTVKDQLQIPHAPAIFAPSMSPSAPCALTNSKGFSIPIGGATKGTSSADANCDRREAARVLIPLNPALALKVMCSDPYVAAVATPEDCVYVAAPREKAVTHEDLNKLLEETSKRIGTAFKQSQQK